MSDLNLNLSAKKHIIIIENSKRNIFIFLRLVLEQLPSSRAKSRDLLGTLKVSFFNAFEMPKY